MSEERKLATVLFADIVGSTATGAFEDPEVVRRTLSRAFAEMRLVLETHGGTVEKFIGDAVMAVFGVPTAHDDDADRAVRAASALRDRVSRLNSGGRFPLELRIGVNTGQVVTGTSGETLVTGPAVNEAARLEQAAAAGEILVGALTRRLTAGGVEFGSSRLVKAKGIGELDSAPLIRLTSALPEQHRGLPGLSAPLIGRDEELALLIDGSRKIRHERRAALVTIFGDAGVGKSRLVREFVLATGDARVRRGRCLPYGEGITFWPVSEVLRADAEISALDGRDDALMKLRTRVLGTSGDDAADADGIARRLGVLAGLASAQEALPDIAEDELANELRWAFRRYVEDRAQDEPLVLVFDDIHWAEPALLDLLEHVTEWTRAPLFLVCLARPELREKRPTWGGGLMNASAIRLEPLTDEESARLIHHLLEIDQLTEERRSEIVQRAEGNPLYVEELIRTLLDTGLITRRDGRFVVTTSLTTTSIVPPTLRGLIAARLDAAPAIVKQALQRASVVGKVFWPEAITSQDERFGRVGDALAEAARRDLVVELGDRALGGGRSWSFRHILVRDVAYDSLPKAERARAHDAFGRWLEANAGSRLEEYEDILTYHAEQAFLLAHELAEPGGSELGQRAFVRLIRAGSKALNRWDLHAATVFFRRARSIAEAIDAGPRALAESAALAAVARIFSESSEEAAAKVRALLPDARAAGPSQALVELLLVAGGLDRQSGQAAHAAELDAEAVNAARALNDPAAIASALLRSSFTPWWQGDLVRHREILLEALEYMRASGAQRLEGHCLRMLSQNADFTGDFAAAHTYVEAMIQVASPSPLHRMYVARWRARLAWQAGDLVGAEALCHEEIRLATDVGMRSEIGQSRATIGFVLRDKGDLVGARRMYEESLVSLSSAVDTGLRVEVRAQLARFCLALGDLDAARAHAEAARREVASDDEYTQATSAGALAQVRAAEGRVSEAEALFRTGLERVGRTGYRGVHMDLLREFGEFLLGQGRIAEARSALQKVRAFYDSDLVSLERDRVDALLLRTEPTAAATKEKSESH